MSMYRNAMRQAKKQSRPQEVPAEPVIAVRRKGKKKKVGEVCTTPDPMLTKIIQVR